MMSLRVCRSVGRRSQVGYAMRESVVHRFAPELLRGGSGACLAGLSVLAMAKWEMKYKFNEWMVAQSLHPFQEWALIMKSSTLMNRITNRWKEWDVCNLT